MAGIIKPITDRERTERQARVWRAVASVRLEHVAGDLTIQEMADEIRALNARQRPGL